MRPLLSSAFLWAENTLQMERSSILIKNKPVKKWVALIVSYLVKPKPTTTGQYHRQLTRPKLLTNLLDCSLFYKYF